MNSGDDAGMKPGFKIMDERLSNCEDRDILIADLKSRLEEKTRELKTAEEKLSIEKDKCATVEDLFKKSEENYRNIVENALNGIVIVQDGKIRYCNPALCEMTGYSMEELSSRSFDTFIQPDHRNLVMERHRKRLDGETVENEYSICVTTKGGDTISCDLKAALTIDWQGKPATLAFVKDVTAQKETESALRESEEQYRVFIEKMPVGFSYNRVTVDENNQAIDFVFLDVNESFLRSTRLDKAEIIGVPVTQALPEIRELELDLIKMAGKVALQGENLQGEIYFKTFGKWFEFNSYSTHPGYCNTIFSDITRQKRAEEASEKSKSYLENSLNSAPDSVFLIGPDCRVSFVNHAFTTLLGVAESEIIGKTILDLAPDFISEKKAAWLHKGAETQMISGEPVSGIEIELFHQNGNTIPVSFSAAAIRDQKNRIIGEVVFLKDITERKRTQELMIQTEKMMSVGGLAAGMAHEINNPLGGMLQGAQNIIRRLSPDLQANLKDAQESKIDLEQLALYIKKRKIDDMLAGIISSGERAARIITNMLQFSRQSESSFCPNDINQLIDEVLELSANDYDLVQKFDFTKIKLVKEFESNLPQVPCTKTEIEQVVLNLLKNAVQAMMETAEVRAPQLVLRTAIEEQAVRIEVEDNGPGLNPGVQKRIFEPFFTTKPVGTGTGLGLSVSYMIVTNNHRGSLEVNSEPGKGACFIIRLPLQSDS